MNRSRPACLLAAALLLGGCERRMHDMYEQPRFDPGEASALFADGRAERPPPEGSVPVAAGDLAATSSGRHGREPPAAWQEAAAGEHPPPFTPALLARGRERFGIFCLPCHGAAGAGDGPVARRGFPAPPSYHQQRLRDAPDRYLFDVISAGHGVMHGYADRVAPPDRWAIVAYLRALQLSQDAQLAQLPAAVRAKLPPPATGARR